VQFAFERAPGCEQLAQAARLDAGVEANSRNDDVYRPDRVSVRATHGSGDRYDAREMTCAHRRHPFGTVLRVTELESGRSVLVTVTDRVSTRGCPLVR